MTIVRVPVYTLFGLIGAVLTCAAHLLERAGFGGTPEAIQALAALTPRDAVRRLARYRDVKDVDLPPFAEMGIYPSPTFNRGSDPFTGKNTITFSLVVRNKIDKRV